MVLGVEVHEGEDGSVVKLIDLEKVNKHVLILGTCVQVSKDGSSRTDGSSIF